MVRELFVMAREHAPSIIFMDEIDSIGSSRLEGGSGGDSEVQRTMLELLNQLDGFEATKNIKVVAHPHKPFRIWLVLYCEQGSPFLTSTISIKISLLHKAWKRICRY